MDFKLEQSDLDMINENMRKMSEYILKSENILLDDYEMASQLTHIKLERKRRVFEEYSKQIRECLYKEYLQHSIKTLYIDIERMRET